MVCVFEGGGNDDYHIAILDPSGLTPMAKIDFVTGDPEALVEKIAGGLESVAPVYADQSTIREQLAQQAWWKFWKK